MDYLEITVLAVFVLVGGFIAVIADELGRRIGKRRLSLHRRIRPRHTAKILTFLSGVMITLVTMTLIGISSSDMRTLLLHGRKAIEDLQGQKLALEAEVDKRKSENRVLDTNIRDLTSQLLQEQYRLKQAETKRN